MAEPVKKDDALAAAVREAFHRHMENARLASVRPPQSLVSSRKVDETGASVRLKPVPPAMAAPSPTMPASAAGSDSSGATAASVSRPTPSATGVPTRHSSMDARSAPRERSMDARAPAENRTAPGGQTPQDDVRLPSVASSPADLHLAAVVAALEDLSSDAPADIEPIGSQEAFPLVPTQAETRGSRFGMGAVTPMGSGSGTAEGGPATGSGRVIDADAVRSTADMPEQDAARGDRRLAVPSPANDRELRRLSAIQAREDLTGRLPVEPARARSGDGKPNRSATVLPPRPGAAPYREAANLNRDARFGSGSREVEKEKPKSRWTVIVVLTLVSLICIGVGGYVWVQTDRTSTSAARPAAGLVAPASTRVVVPVAAPAAETSLPGVAAPKRVRTTAITLDAVDVGVQDARERIAAGDIRSARLILERFRDRNDPRALVALAETYDPALIHDASLADAKEARQLYEAAGKAGIEGMADRVARLQPVGSD